MGLLTTHVLDTASGKPGAGIPFDLYRLDHDHELILSGRTNSDGRTAKPLLAEEKFQPGTYELVFRVAKYFAATTVPTAKRPFLSDIPIRFTLSDDTHYHVPLLVSPWSYSTYRGS